MAKTPPRILNRPTRVSKGLLQAQASWGSTSNSNRQRDPFGPAMAEDLFEVYSDEQECSPVSDYQDASTDYPEDEGYTEQLSLTLETVEELEERFRGQLNKFEKSYSRMMIYALNWYYLERECDEDPQIEKMFKDMQMIRKLRGSEVV